MLDIQLIPLSTSFFLHFLLRPMVAVGSGGLTSWRAMSRDRLEAQPINLCFFFFCLRKHSFEPWQDQPCDIFCV